VARRILIVEDERDLLDALTYTLERQDFRAEAASTGEAALRFLQDQAPPALVLLDLMLPDMSGLDLCRRIRHDKQLARLPIIMLTAKADEIDRVVGFEVGADDYVTKPFSTSELVLRIRAVLRRDRRAAPDVTPAKAVEYGLLRVDAEGHRAWVGGAPVELTALEFRLLITLVERRGRVQSRERLLEDVWGPDTRSKPRAVDTLVKRLRRKLGAAGAYLETLREAGYRLRRDLTEDA
jgi:two-component system, OmpR family, phosphate regulon response regulator PhoB